MAPSASAEVARFLHKSVPFRFHGRDLRFFLSQGLFSSFDIDEGTRLLLKSIEQRVDTESTRAVLDVGCGVGVIGVCIAAQCPPARVLMQDRDALAAAVARENCRLNNLSGAAAECQLAFHGLAGRRFDLVTSNLPAKAGAPVLSAMLRHAAGCLRSAGLAAVVVVEPLAAWIRQVIVDLGCAVVYEEQARSYSVFHFQAGATPTETVEQLEDLSPYIRDRRTFQIHGLQYSLETAFALPDFDTLGYDLELCLDLLPLLNGGSAGFWNPGQGHLPAALAAAKGKEVSSIVIAGRDCLECRMAGRNLASQGVPVSAARLLGSEAELATALAEGSLDLLVAAPHPVPRVPWQEDLAHAARAVLKPGGQLLVTARSTEIHRFLQRARGLSLVAAKKREGFRAALLRKPDATPP
jgi:16S rRNA (guanine1207-N2)-methyltransferase